VSSIGSRSLREELQRTLEAAPFTEMYRFSLVSVGDGCCALRVPYGPHLDRPGRMIAGHVLMAAADVSVWLALQSKFDDRLAVTSSMNTHFLRKAVGSDVVCRARLIREGRRLVVGIAECSQSDGELLSYHTVTYARSAQCIDSAWNARSDVLR
jgi:acyl-coenzyme A thioesterase PaaI-like protein